LLWQANLTLSEDGPQLLTGKLSSGDYVLDIRGAVQLSGPKQTIQMRASGRDGTATAGWIYDYIGSLTYNWPDGDEQRPTIAGTVIRTAPHAPSRPAGATYSFVAVNQDSPAPLYALPAPVVSHFADKVHRLHHAVWHGIREMWEDLTPEDQERIRELDWQVEGDRIALVSSQRTRPALENGSGEDFLFFHRQMVDHYRMMMKDLDLKTIDWPEVPQPGAGGIDNPNIVPRAWKIVDAPNFERRVIVLKSDDFFWSRMRWWEVEFKRKDYLASLTLGELGALLQYSIHNDMHIRWSATPRDPDTNALIELGRPEWDISDKWDNPKYDWLGEFYSSHVNPVFWRLHGWIDDRIDDWAAAHGWKRPNSIKKIKLGGVDWFETGDWVHVKYPWVWPRSLGGIEGGMSDPPELRAKKIDSMKKVMAILFPPPESARLVRSADPATRRRRYRANVIGLS